MSFPSLWSVAHLGNKVPIHMLLQRSGGHPLGRRDHPIPRIDFQVQPRQPGADVSAHAPRIRKLVFYPDADGDDIKSVVKILSMPAPNLTHLELVLLTLDGGTVWFPRLFGLEFPKLTVLKVAGVESWPEIVWANLTHITVDGSLNPPALRHCIPYSPNL